VEELGADGEAKRPSVEAVVAKLVRHFKWLQDAYVLKPTAAGMKGEESKEPSSSSSAAAAATPASSASSSEARVVYLLKKAQLICGDLYSRFHDDAALKTTFGFGDIGALTVFADNVLPAVLRAKGVLKYAEPLARIVDAGEKLKNREQEAAIRAAAVEACERIVHEYNSKHAATAKENEEKAAAATPAADAATTPTPGPLTAMALDYHLWLLGKTPEFRSLPRHATHSPFY
jgi:hypothetical protein